MDEEQSIEQYESQALSEQVADEEFKAQSAHGYDGVNYTDRDWNYTGEDLTR